MEKSNEPSVKLDCTYNKKTKQISCHSKDKLTDEQAENMILSESGFSTVFGIDEPTPQNTAQQNFSKATGLIITVTLISGFGFAFAYLLLYIVYDYASGEIYKYNPLNVVISFIILGSILFLLVTISFFMVRGKALVSTPPIKGNASDGAVHHQPTFDNPDIPQKK